MIDRPLAPWEDPDRPFVLIAVDGPLDARVEISNAPDGGGAAIVAVTWTRDGEPRTVSAPADDNEAASTIAHQWADLRAVGDDSAVRAA